MPWKLGGREGRLENPSQAQKPTGKGPAQGHTLNSTGSRVSPSYSRGNGEQENAHEAPLPLVQEPGADRQWRDCRSHVTRHFLLPSGLS